MLTKKELNKKITSSEAFVTEEGKLSLIDVDLGVQGYHKMNRVYYQAFGATMLGVFSAVLIPFGIIAIPVFAAVTAVILITCLMVCMKYLALYSDTVTTFSPIVSKWLKEQYNLQVTERKAKRITCNLLLSMDGSVTGADKKKYRIARLTSGKEWEVQEVTFIQQQQSQFHYTTLTPSAIQTSS